MFLRKSFISEGTFRAYYIRGVFEEEFIAL